MTNPTDPTFACVSSDGRGGGYQQDGLTKREYFAAMALQGLLANSNDRLVSADDETIAMTAVDAANALINALNKKNETT